VAHEKVRGEQVKKKYVSPAPNRKVKHAKIKCRCAGKMQAKQT